MYVQDCLIGSKCIHTGTSCVHGCCGGQSRYIACDTHMCAYLTSVPSKRAVYVTMELRHVYVNYVYVAPQLDNALSLACSRIKTAHKHQGCTSLSKTLRIAWNTHATTSLRNENGRQTAKKHLHFAYYIRPIRPACQGSQLSA